jgi:F420-dependent oxidoreductase-like protein
MSARIAAYVDPATGPFKDSVERVRFVERLGFDSVWVTQLVAERDASLVLAAYARATDHIGLGGGVFPIAARHPTAVAQMAATLDEWSGGRFRLGLGVSNAVIVEWMWGLKWARPLEAMREYLTIVRAGLRLGEVDFRGAQFSARWSYSPPRRPDLPILIGAVSPKMLELAGELADGVVLWMCSPAYVRSCVIPHVRAGRAKAGLSLDGFEVISLIPVGITTDLAAGYAAVRQAMHFYTRVPIYQRVLEASGYARDVTSGTLSHHTLTQLTGLGTADTVRDTIARYRAAGCTLPAIWPFAGFAGSARCEATLEAAA